MHASMTLHCTNIEQRTSDMSDFDNYDGCTDISDGASTPL